MQIQMSQNNLFFKTFKNKKKIQNVKMTNYF